MKKNIIDDDNVMFVYNKLKNTMNEIANQKKVTTLEFINGLILFFVDVFRNFIKRIDEDFLVKFKNFRRIKE